MKKFLFTFVVLLSSFCGLHADQSIVKQQMLRDLDFIHYIFMTNYAPTMWKNHHFGWDLDKQIQEAKGKVRNKNKLSVSDYHVIVNEFFRSTRDYHVGVQFYSTEHSSLPFTVKSAEGRYYLTYIDRSLLPQNFFPAEVGDELVLFDGKPTDMVVKQIKKEALFNDGTITGDGNDRTDQAKAEERLTFRFHGDNTIPKGSINVAIKKKNADILTHYTLSWQHTPEKIPENTFANFNKGFVTPKAAALTKVAPLQDSIAKHSKIRMAPAFWNPERSRSQSSEANLHTSGARKSFIPRLGPVLWEIGSSNPFDAYLFESPEGKKVGYVRIANYDGDDHEVKYFAEIIRYLEANSDALVIDQVNNPGGSVYYLYALASMLTEKPLELPKHRMAITQSDILNATTLIPYLENIKYDFHAKMVLDADWCGYPITAEIAKSLLEHSHFIINEWNSGKAVTKPYHIAGIKTIQPSSETQYTKPILLLTNEMDFSGGDFFPAILQDNHRVTILGSNTAGAGGCVQGLSYPNILGVSGFQYTSTLAERSNNNPIENLGVQPDIEYHLSAYDFQNNYSEYVNIILSTLKGMN